MELMSETWLRMTACELGRGLAAGDIDPVRLAGAYLDAIRNSPHQASIYTVVTDARATSEAGRARQRQAAGQRTTLLDGVPITWKDLFDVRAVPTEGGSAIYKGRIAPNDAIALALAGQAGMVCLGKTHMSELAFSGLGLNPVTATPGCINDPDCVAGGSSSGAAASVAHGLTAAAIGTDTGGSVRIPAAWNDLVGFKTSLGRIDTRGTLPLCPSFDTIGPICRSVEDAAALLAVLTSGRVGPLPDRRVRDMVFLVPLSDDLEPVDDGPQEAFNEALARLRRAGARVIESPLACLGPTLQLAPVLFCTEAYAAHAEAVGDRWDCVFAGVRDRFLAGRNVAAHAYINALAELGERRREYRQATQGYDGVLLPTCPIMPPAIQRLLSDPDYYTERNLHALRNTRIANLMDIPALTLPTGTPSTGLMLWGRNAEEMTLLAIGAALETVLATP